MASSVATFNDTMADIIYELDDREIYNDIRSQIDVTETIIVGDAGAEYDEKTIVSSDFPLNESETRSVTLTVLTGHTALSWFGFLAYANYGIWSGPVSTTWTPTVTSQDGTTIVFDVTNPQVKYAASAWVRATYRYLSRPEISHPETGQRTLTVRSTDTTSIAKYGRRVMYLPWPLGQTEVQMQTLVDAYKTRHSEPVARLSMTLLGRDDNLIVQILTRKVSELVTVVNTELGLNDTFYINTINPEHNIDGLLQARWTLEESRTEEDATLFTLDTSLLDGAHILGS
jgi:hypothetical protein